MRPFFRLFCLLLIVSVPLTFAVPVFAAKTISKSFSINVGSTTASSRPSTTGAAVLAASPTTTTPAPIIGNIYDMTDSLTPGETQTYLLAAIIFALTGALLIQYELVGVGFVAFKSILTETDIKRALTKNKRNG